MARIMTERMDAPRPPLATALDERAMRGEGRRGDAMEALRAGVAVDDFAVPSPAPPMPPMQMSLECYARTWDSIHHELARQALAPLLGGLDVPTRFVLGADSPIPPRHGLASAAVIPGGHDRRPRRLRPLPVVGASRRRWTAPSTPSRATLEHARHAGPGR